MNLALNEEQKLLQAAASRFVERQADPHARRCTDTGSGGRRPDEWRRFAENGWLSLRLGRDVGGAGATAVDSMVLIRELGRGLLVEPLIPTAVLAGTLLEAYGTAEQRRDYVSRVGTGSLEATVALLEPGSRFDLGQVKTSATPSAGGFVLAGRKTMVWHGPTADLLIVSARTSGARCDRRGISLFLVDASQTGVHRHDLVTVDGGRASELLLENVRVEESAAFGPVGEAFGALTRLADEAIVALGAEALGCMQALHAMTLDYVKVRKQFGQPIGSFQAVQHRLADMFIACEAVQSLLLRAAIDVATDGPDARSAAAALKVKVGQAGRFVGQNAVQLHGGMGMTDALPVGLFFKRLTAIDAQFGSAGHHLQRFASLTQREGAGE